MDLDWRKEVALEKMGKRLSMGEGLEYSISEALGHFPLFPRVSVEGHTSRGPHCVSTTVGGPTLPPLS